MKILSNEIAQHYQIASLNRGHVVFTSFISRAGKILFLDPHIERLLRGASFLFPIFQWEISHQKIKEYVLNIFKEDSSDAYFRLTIFDDCIYLQRKVLEFESVELSLTSAIKIKTPGLIPAYLKLSNYLEADLEVRQAKLNGFDDVVFFDWDGYVSEASTSNLFIVTMAGVIKTPPISPMVLAGITREQLIKNLPRMNLVVQVEPITKAELEGAQEIWLTNSVKGIRFVSQYEQNKFERKNSIFEKVTTFLGRFGELI